MKTIYYDDFEYELDYSEEAEVLEEIKKIIKKDAISSGCVSDKDIIQYIISEYDLGEDVSIEDDLDEVLSLASCVAWDDFEDFVKDYFREIAYENYQDYLDYRRDPLGYYGMSRSDFI